MKRDYVADALFEWNKFCAAVLSDDVTSDERKAQILGEAVEKIHQLIAQETEAQQVCDEIEAKRNKA